MMSRHFRLRSELSGAIAKRLPHAKNQLSAPDNHVIINNSVSISRQLAFSGVNYEAMIQMN